MLTGKSTINLNGEFITKLFNPLGNKAIGINCPDKKILSMLYETISALTSPNQNAKQTIEKYIVYDKNIEINKVIKKPNVCNTPIKIYPWPMIIGVIDIIRKYTM